MTAPFSTARALLRWLSELADKGQPCPSSQVMADFLGHVGTQNIPRTLRTLQKAGFIVLGGGTPREITIVATGKTLRGLTIAKRGPYNRRLGEGEISIMGADAIQARRDADQAAIRARMEAQLDAHAAKYGTRPRPIQEMVA